MKTVIGLETHLQLKSASKFFCSCSTANYRDAPPNSRVCPTCLSQPGAKPHAPNSTAVENALKIAIALNCKVATNVDVPVQRKHYIYPDLASGYQRTSKPIGVQGTLAGVRIREVHVEEDPGQYDLKTGRVNFNRSGIPLIEIVTDPDIETPQQARDFLEQLNAIVEYLGAGREEAGSLRVDANLSISVDGKEGTRAEVKNINSFKGVATALAFEASRQKNLLKNNLRVVQETRHFDEDAGVTRTMRRKENAEDYRYFPDPDVPPIRITPAAVEETRARMPELPAAKMKRFEKQFAITPQEAFAITLEKEMADAFEKHAAAHAPKLTANFYRGALKKQLNWRNLRFKDAAYGNAVGEILEMLEDGEVTEKVAEQLLISFLDEKLAPKENAESQGLLGIESGEAVEDAVKSALEENTKAVADYRAGKLEALHYLAGQVVKKTRGKASPEAVKKLLEKML